MPLYERIRSSARENSQQVLTKKYLLLGVHEFMHHTSSLHGINRKDVQEIIARSSRKNNPLSECH